MTKTMVFGDDGSVRADVAWLWVNNHRWPGWRVEVLHAVVPEIVRVGAPHADARPWHPAQRRVPFGGTFDEAEELLIEQDPRLALGRRAELLVIGARGPGLLKSMHLGSTAEWLMSRPPTPMIIARHGRDTRRILMCADGSPSSAAAVEALAMLPWIDRAEVHVVSVADGRTDAEAAVRLAGDRLAAARARVVRQVLEGDPADELLAYGRAIDVDLVALGTRGLTGLGRWVIGSTANALSHSTDASLLLACDEAEVTRADEACDERPPAGG